MGAGKTTVSKLIHDQTKNVALLGKDRIKWSLSGFVRSKPQNATANAVTLAMVKAYLAHGASIMMDQSFVNPTATEPYIRAAKSARVPVVTIRLDAPLTTLLARLATRPKPTSAKTAVTKTRIMRNIRGYYAKPVPKGVVTVQTDGRTPEEIASDVLKQLRSLLK